MKVQSLHDFPISLTDNSFLRHVIMPGKEYELPDNTDVSYFVSKGVLKVFEAEEIENTEEEKGDTEKKDVNGELLTEEETKAKGKGSK